MNRAVLPLSEAFLNNGRWYVLSSTSLGGHAFSPEEMESKLCSKDAQAINTLLNDGVCLPLYFSGDGALDQAVIVQGDLSPQEEAEWIGRIRWKLKIPSGTFFIMGGTRAEHFQAVLSQHNTDEGQRDFFQKLSIDSGDYLVEVYAFLGSMTFNEHWDELVQPDAGMLGWFQRTRPEQDEPAWLNALREDGYIDRETFHLLEYIIRLSPLSPLEEAEIPFPELDEEHFWCGSFELRKPAKCPLGISRDSVQVPAQA